MCSRLKFTRQKHTWNLFGKNAALFSIFEFINTELTVGTDQRSVQSVLSLTVPDTMQEGSVRIGQMCNRAFPKYLACLQCYIVLKCKVSPRVLRKYSVDIQVCNLLCKLTLLLTFYSSVFYNFNATKYISDILCV